MLIFQVLIGNLLMRTFFVYLLGSFLKKEKESL